MTDEEYFACVDKVIAEVRYAVGPSTWEVDVIGNWREEVAPQKHKEYGIECWQRMGTRALVADISACFYRYKKLTEIGKTKGTPMYNVMLDSFGYAVIYTVCKYEDKFREGWDGPTLGEIYEHEPITKAEPVLMTNEKILAVGWDGSGLGYVEALAMRQALNMYGRLPV